MQMKKIRRVTLQDIAEHVGVSKITVSCALREDRKNVAAATIKRIKAAAVELGYDPAMAHAARRLRYQNETAEVVNQLVGVYFPFEMVVHRYFALIFRGMQNALLRRRYGLLACTWNIQGGPLGEQLPHVFRRGEVDGVLFFATEQNHRALVEGLRGEPGFGKRPIVALTEPFPDCSAVLVDDFQVGYEQADHLLTLGHRRLMHFESRRLVTYITQQRTRGMSKAVLAHGLDPTEVIVNVEWIWEAHTDWEADLRALLTAHPEVTAILCPNDDLGVPMVHALQRWGVSVPEAMSLIGTDDSEELLNDDGDNLWTTVRLPLEALGARAAELLMARIEDRDKPDTIETLPPERVVRGTTAPPRTGPLLLA